MYAVSSAAPVALRLSAKASAAANTGVVGWVCCPIGRDGNVASCASS